MLLTGLKQGPHGSFNLSLSISLPYFQINNDQIYQDMSKGNSNSFISGEDELFQGKHPSQLDDNA